MTALAEVIAYASGEGLLVVVDGKRNDIGTTADGLRRGVPGAAAAERLGRRCADGQPVPGRGQSGAVRGTGRGARRGHLRAWSRPRIPAAGCSRTFATAGTARRCISTWRRSCSRRRSARVGACGYGAVGAVVGATYPEQLAELRQAMPNTWLLVPGYGAREPRRATCAMRLTRGWPGRGRQQLTRHHLRVRTPEYRERFERGPVAAGGGSRHAFHDRSAASETAAGRLEPDGELHNAGTKDEVLEYEGAKPSECFRSD